LTATQKKVTTRDRTLTIGERWETATNADTTATAAAT